MGERGREAPPSPLLILLFLRLSASSPKATQGDLGPQLPQPPHQSFTTVNKGRIIHGCSVGRSTEGPPPLQGPFSVNTLHPWMIHHRFRGLYFTQYTVKQATTQSCQKVCIPHEHWGLFQHIWTGKHLIFIKTLAVHRPFRNGQEHKWLKQAPVYSVQWRWCFPPVMAPRLSHCSIVNCPFQNPQWDGNQGFELGIPKPSISSFGAIVGGFFNVLQIIMLNFQFNLNF